MSTTLATPYVLELDDDGKPIQSNTPVWLRRRQTGLGGSDAPGWLGLSPWVTPRDIYLSKVVDTIVDEQTEAMEFGHRLEPVIVATVRDRHGDPDNPRHRYLGQIEKGPGLMRSVEFPHLLASLDAVVIEPDGTRAPLNAKNVSVYRRKSFEAGEFGVPDDVAVQVFHEAIVAGTDHGYAAPFFGNTMPEPIRLDVPDDFRAWYVESAAEWWDGHVEARVEPEPLLADDLSEVWQPIPGLTVDLDPIALDALAERKTLKARVKADEAKIDELDLLVKRSMGEATDAWDRTDPTKPRLVATWRPHAQPREVFHRDELLADHPEVADLLAGYTRRDGATPRPFLVK